MGQQVVRHPAHKLTNTLRDTARGVRQLSTGTTTYIADPTSGDCQAIIGNLGADNLGNETGLSGWGIAINSGDGFVTLEEFPGVIGNWTAIGGYTNSWTGSGTFIPGALRDAAGIVHFKGLLVGGTSGAAAFTLSPGFRPVDTIFFPVLTAGGAAGTFIEITAAGVVSPTVPSPTSNGAWLSTISYPAAG